jgi:uncharacterized protein (DUF302 family)
MHAIETIIDRSPAEAEAAARDALGAQGFGVLTEIDVAATLKAKLGVDRSPLKILGACNPALAHQALQVDPAVSLVLPCNVVIEATDTGTRVAAVDPHDLMDDPRFTTLADEAAQRLRAAIASLGG